MENNKNKKKKLTLSGQVKRPAERQSFAKTRNKSSVLIEKKITRNKTISKSFYTKKPTYKPSNLGPSGTFSNKNQQLRKLAEQRATKRIKEFDSDEKSKQYKNKGSFQKREYKLTLSRALDDEGGTLRERSLASVRRARLKEKKNIQNGKKEINLKKVVREVNIPDVITIQELSNRMAEQASKIIKHLFDMGVTATINHTIDADTAEYLVKEFGNKPIREKKPDLKFKNLKSDNNAELKIRPPIVTIMGHVDHGKTSLLDAMRKTNIVSEEFGGITQHIGAYQINLKNNKKITFIDTPGHAAFTQMRARGSKITDIVILVVAADDGIKPQTIEAIKHAKAAKVPIIVAINKCDLPDANPQKIKNQLLEYELIAEELSGETLVTEVSAITKKNLDKLQESILLQAEILDLKADYDCKAKGVILESSIDKGRGPVSTVLITEGNLKISDYFVSGKTWGKIRAMIDFNGKKVESALPSDPVEILGMNSSAYSGDDFIVVDSESKAKEIFNYRKQNIDSNKNSLILATKESAFDKSSKIKELSIIIKSDVHGSCEALKNVVNKMDHSEVKPKIILADVGMISETDVSLAKASNAILLGFNIKASKEAKKLAESDKIKIAYFNIIYEAIDFVTAALSGLLKPEIKEEVIGSAEILEIFKVSKIGKVAGSKVIDGEILNNSNARLIRDGSILYTGKISSIFREKNAAKQVAAGLECGITLKDFADFKEKDVIEAYKVVETERRI